MDGAESLRKISEILTEAQKRGASDIHMTPGTRMMFRIDGELAAVSEENVKPLEVEELMLPILTKEQRERLKEAGEIDFAYSMDGDGRLRVSIFRQRGTYAMNLRLLSFEIPSPESLGIPASIVDLTSCRSGLVLVTGAGGNGKSTTLASLIRVISKKYAKTVVTLEDPIEYLHHHNQSMVMQREIGGDSADYATAIKSAIRQDADVILVGELKDLETTALAISAAEMGHLVFSTLHTGSAAASIDRLVEIFPSYQQQMVRIQIADVLEGIVTQKLLPRQNEKGRAAAFEILFANREVRSLIREGKTNQITALLQTSRKEGMQTMDDAIYDLYRKSIISADTAIFYAQDTADMQRKTRLF